VLKWIYPIQQGKEDGKRDRVPGLMTMKNIDFKEEVMKRKDQMIDDLRGLIRINSELTEFDPNRKGAPFGEGTKEALDYVLRLGDRDGFKTVNVDGYAGHIEFGEQKDFIGMIGHLDVVPAGNDWTYDPYGAEIHDGRMYGRGTEDDKGPTIAVYYAMKILKELGVSLDKRIKLILGNDEETAWRCMRHYFSIYPEVPVAGFIPDADFPLIYAEKGISRIVIEGKLEKGDLLSIDGGFRDNMVPDYATAKLAKTRDYKHAFEVYLKKMGLKGSVETFDAYVQLSVTGKSAHGSTPEEGDNAIDRMFAFLIEAKVEAKLVDLVRTYLYQDFYGKKLSIDYTDEEMGALTNNFGVISTKDNTYSIALNLRYPRGVIFSDVVDRMRARVKAFDATLTVDNHKELIYTDPSSKLVTKLMDIYKKHTNDRTAEPISIGGGTFARAMPNSVAFGPHFLEKPTYIHQKNEFIDIDDLLLATVIYTEALYELSK
jgi:succinyl-diaminopimelate desuccinylase